MKGKISRKLVDEINRNKCEVIVSYSKVPYQDIFSYKFFLVSYFYAIYSLKNLNWCFIHIQYQFALLQLSREYYNLIISMKAVSVYDSSYIFIAPSSAA